MKTKIFALVFGTVTACGGSNEEPARALTLHRAYDALAVVRVHPDGVESTAIFSVFFRITDIDVASDRATGVITPDANGENYAFDGRFESDGNFVMPLDTATLTASSAEEIQELGGRAADTTPEDGVADEINGYLRTRRGQEIHSGVFFGVAQQPARPEEVDETKVTVRPAAELGQIEITGAPGAVIGRAGVEIFRFKILDSDPDFTLIQAMGDGSFSAKVAGIEEDAFVLRARVIGKASDARYFTVTP